MSRTSEKQRVTNETRVSIRLDLDGSGRHEVSTGIPFFDHMLAQLARHGRFDLRIDAKGDLEIDGHHTVEDVGLTLGQAFTEALGERRGIARFAHAYVPLDEALSRVVVDFSGRGFLIYRARFESAKIGDLQTELIEEFFKAFVQEGRLNLHVEAIYGRNQHHIAETIFKAAARALHLATRVAFDDGEIPSTKGTL
jgi:imidazoleglycerol-phosphate dehydratase